VAADDPRTLSESLDGLLRDLRAGARHEVGGVFGRWEELVGAVLAAHARPVKLDGGRLLVEVDEPGWATQLRFLESDVLARLHDGAGIDLSGIDVRVGPPARPQQRGDARPRW
jgi:predicted nucleic acid-binding Zn ribbon protein